MYMFPIFFLAMMMLYFVTMARGLVREKDLKLKEGMCMMGLKELPYWAAWLSYYSIFYCLLFSLKKFDWFNL
jgi:ABC-2 family transporter protein